MSSRLEDVMKNYTSRSSNITESKQAEELLSSTDVEKLKSLLSMNQPAYTRFHIRTTGKELYEILKVAFVNQVRSRYMYPRFDEAQDRVLRTVAEYISADYVYGEISDKCTIEQIDRTFGLLFTGQPGNGKTTLIAALQKILNIIGMRDPSAPSTEIRELYLPVYTAPQIMNMFTQNKSKFDAICKKHIIAIDDVGTESLEVLQYGNIYSPIKELIYSRYNDHLFTILSTNLNKEEFADKYGSRIDDRTNEMLRVFKFPNKTFR